MARHLSATLVISLDVIFPPYFQYKNNQVHTPNTKFKTGQKFFKFFCATIYFSLTSPTKILRCPTELRAKVLRSTASRLF